MLIYRVFPYLASAGAGQPGHPLYVHTPQTSGRWDNDSLYKLGYFAETASGAIGETFQGLGVWNDEMLVLPALPGAVKSLAILTVDEETAPLLDLDDPIELSDRSLRPTQVVNRNRPKTQKVAERVYAEATFCGIRWWSMHRPQWMLQARWNLRGIKLNDVVSIPGHPATADAADLLVRDVEFSD